MKLPIQLALIVALLTGCAHLPSIGGESEDATSLWSQAQESLARLDFRGAETSFGRLARNHGGSLEGRESLFYLGAIRLDPRNNDWDSEIAQERLGEYLAPMGEVGGPRLYRYPEAATLHEIARQLNLPPDSRIESLQPEERVVTIEERVLVPAEQSRELATQVERLRQQVAERDETIRLQQEELDRIRRTLTGPGPGRS